MQERKAVTNELAKRYQHATKGERGKFLAEFIQLTGYSRCYASHVLHNWGTHHIRIVDGERVEVVLGAKIAPKTRKKPRRYDQSVITIRGEDLGHRRWALWKTAACLHRDCFAHTRALW